eukprot:RCo016950
MALFATVSDALGRELHTFEENLLQALSPQGVAKVNADIAKGVPLEQTLSQLRVAFRASKHRQALAKSSVPKALLPVVQEMSRSPTLDELVLLAGVPASTLLRQLEVRKKKGECLEEVLEELALEHRHTLMQEDIRRLATEKGRPAYLSPLGPTTLSASHSTELTVTMMERDQSQRLRVGPSPVVTWFSEPVKVQDNLSGCPSVCSITSPTSPTLPSALKRGPRPQSSPHLSICASSLGPDSGASTPCSESEPQGAFFGVGVPSGEATAAPVGLRVSFGLPDDDGDALPSKPRPARKRGALSNLVAALRPSSGTSHSNSQDPNPKPCLQQRLRSLLSSRLSNASTPDRPSAAKPNVK